MTTQVDISVVIGFKDWGIERLLVSIRSILQSFGSLTGEVIVSDYGSKEPSPVKKAVEALGARYIYTASNGVWSRSRALNAGFAVSGGKVLISTDADMLFTPESMFIIGQRILANNNEALVLQCRDLPERFAVEAIDPSDLKWQDYEENSTLRPRWGMGGMMAVSRHTFLAVRGFDERMEIYGGEDMDFAQRVQWSGAVICWLEDPRVRMYHIWHPSSRRDVSQTPEGLAAIAFNRDIFLNDKSFVRNTKRWIHKPQDAPLLASVVISTRNRADYIAESIYSVLNQTVEDIEVIVIDDGSTDHTESIVRGIADDRIRYYKRDPAGIAAARNFAVGVSKAPYTVVHDDDDIMFPDRIENHFRALSGGVSGTYGGWIDFQNSDGEDCTANPGKDFSLPALLFSSKVYAHATLMVSTALLKQVPYDERLRSGSDYNLALRMARSGIKLAHTGKFHLIRRLHARQVTTADSMTQKSSARVSSSLALRSIRPGKQKVLRERMKALAPVNIVGAADPYELIRPYLPDHLTQRTLRIKLERLSECPEILLADSRLARVNVVDNRTGSILLSYAELRDARWEDMARLTSLGIGFDLVSLPVNGQPDMPLTTQAHVRTCVDRRIKDFLASSSSSSLGVLVLTGPVGSLPHLNRDAIVDLTASDEGKFSVNIMAYTYGQRELSSDLQASLKNVNALVTARYLDGNSSPRKFMRQLESIDA